MTKEEIQEENLAKRMNEADDADKSEQEYLAEVDGYNEDQN